MGFFWNVYFISKLVLFVRHTIGLNFGLNFGLALLLIVPLPLRWMRWLRQLLAIPAGAALLYYDSFLPSFARVWSQVSNVGQFDSGYLLELAARFVNPNAVVAAVVAMILLAVLGRWVRLSTFVMLALCGVPLWMQVQTLSTRMMTANAAAGAPVARSASSAATAGSVAVGNGSGFRPDAMLTAFFQQEATRRVNFLTPSPEAPPDFDVIMLHICSLSWDDLDFAKQSNHPLLARFDVVFKNFSSAASYSGPAAIRVLRAGCGQQRHADLYQPAAPGCLLFEDLKQAGFVPQIAMNHDGRFDDFIGAVKANFGVPNVAPMATNGVAVGMRAFDDSPILDDYAVLSKWFATRQAAAPQPVALYYNTISLHDGNRLPNNRASSMETYPIRLKNLLDQVDRLETLISQSGRKAVLVFIPEHGGATHGDELQVAGLREIPTYAISRVPVGVKLIGMTAANPVQKVIEAPSSYLAMAQLLANFVQKSPFTAGRDLNELTKNLPTTDFVAENAETLVVRHDQTDWMRGPDGVWLEGGKK